MAKNLGREFATMTEDERRRFALEHPEAADEIPAELEFDDPRDEDKMGRQYPNLQAEVADPENRDGMSAQLDDDEHWENLRRPTRTDSGINVGSPERWISGIAGAALIALGLGRKRFRGFLIPLGGSLIARGITGCCPVNARLGRNTARRREARETSFGGTQRSEEFKIEQSVVIARPRDELFRFWRNLENLPRFMDHLQSVTVSDDRHSHWVVRGPAGVRLEWDAEITHEVENELIAWRSLPGSDLDHRGAVHFSPVHNGGTEVRVILRYQTRGGSAAHAITQILGERPSNQIVDDLRRFKQVMEAGEPVPGSVSGRA
jgi:uncharacterized membrane protein